MSRTLKELYEELDKSNKDLDVMKRHNYDQSIRYYMMMKIGRLQQEVKEEKQAIKLEMQTIKEEIGE